MVRVGRSWGATTARAGERGRWPDQPGSGKHVRTRGCEPSQRGRLLMHHDYVYQGGEVKGAHSGTALRHVKGVVVKREASGPDQPGSGTHVQTMSVSPAVPPKLRHVVQKRVCV